MNLEEEIRIIKERNAKVEADKAWETSIARTCMLALVTYILVSIFLIIINNDNPFINALVPTLGYLLSVQSMSWVKSRWLKRKK